MSVFIKVVDDVVTLAGTILSENMEKDGYFEYEGEIPNASRLLWDDDKKIIIPDFSIDIENQKNKFKESLIKDLQQISVHTLNGEEILLANTAQDQTNSLLAISTSQQILQSPKHKVNTNYKKYDTVNLNGSILLCLKSGKSNKTKPTPTTEFKTRLKDGSVEWVLFGQLLGLHPTGVKFFTPQDVLYMTGQSNLYITKLRQKYSMLKEQVLEIKTINDIEKIEW